MWFKFEYRSANNLLEGYGALECVNATKTRSSILKGHTHTRRLSLKHQGSSIGVESIDNNGLQRKNTAKTFVINRMLARIFFNN